LRLAYAVMVGLLAAIGGCGPSAQPHAPAEPETFAKDCSPPPTNWRKPTGIREDVTRNVIRVDASRNIEWNGAPITWEQLREFVREVDRLPAPELRLVATPDAKCVDVRAIRGLMNGLAMCRRSDGECLEGTSNLPAPVN